MAKRLLSFTCAECGDELPISECVVVSGKRYCKRCAPVRQSESDAYKKIGEIVDQKLNHDEEMIGFTLTQISKLKAANKWKFTGILKALEYAYGPLNDFKDPIEKGYSIRWIAEYFYPIARQQWEDEQRIKKLPQNILNLAYLDAKDVHVKESEILKREEIDRERIKTRIYGPTINLDDLDDSEPVEEE